MHSLVDYDSLVLTFLSHWLLTFYMNLNWVYGSQYFNISSASSTFQNQQTRLMRGKQCESLTWILPTFQYRFRLIPAFGDGTIRPFSEDVSDMTRPAARNYEDILQVGFKGIFPD